jgi:hypothetical protein
MTTVQAQKGMYYGAVDGAGRSYDAFMELVNDHENPLTKRDLIALIARRPQTWERFAGFMDQLPD